MYAHIVHERDEEGAECRVSLVYIRERASEEFSVCRRAQHECPAGSRVSATSMQVNRYDECRENVGGAV
jgi:hypothetical protein